MARKKDVETKAKGKDKEAEGKEKTLKEMFANIKKQFGDGAIMRLGEATKLNVKSISTGSVNLDMALGIGGVPRGRIIEIYGAESSGKTTLALHIVAEAQKEKKDAVVAFIDAEHALDPVYAKALGVNIDELLVSQPDTGEQALELADMLVRSGAIDVIVIDSVAALVPKAEIDGEMSDQQMGLQARLMSKGLRKLTANISKSETVMIFINQIREKIGGYGPGPQTTTSGGRALKFFSSVRMEVKRVGSVKQGDDIVGNEVTVKVTKNKVAPPFREAKFNVMYGKGISRIGEILEAGENFGVIAKSGSWYSYKDEKLGQGKANVETLLETTKQDLYKQIEEEVLVLMKENNGNKPTKKKGKKEKDDDTTEVEETEVITESNNSLDDEILDIEDDLLESFDDEE